VSILVDATNPTTEAAATLGGEGLGRALAARYRIFATGAAATALRAAPEGRRQFTAESDLVIPDAIRVTVVSFYNPERRTPVFIVPGLVGVILTMTMMLMTALAIVRERERGTLEFLIATPVRRGELMLGKILPYVLVGHIQVALILALGALLFGVPLQGSLVDLGFGAAVFIAAMLTMGLVISAAARTQFQAMQMAFFFFLPSMLLSGFMFPFEAMPRPAQWIGQVLPLTHFLRVARGVLLKGATLGSLLGEIAAIAGFMAAALVLAVASFRKRLG
jgi:ABC-2 type transport system permease protein